MSIEAMIWVRKHAPVETSVEMCILYSLADRANDDGSGCWPYYETIANEARCSLPTVKRHIKNLEARGLLVRGDQSLVDKYPKYRRPIVWNLNLTLRREAQDDLDRVKCQNDTALKRGITGDEVRYQPEQSEVSLGAKRGITGDTDNPPITSLQPSFNPPAQTVDAVDEFDQWWEGVPRKKAKGDARKAFATARKSASLDELIEGMKRSCATWTAEGRAVSKIPYPATWLRAESWNDEPDNWQAPATYTSQDSNTVDAWLGTSRQNPLNQLEASTVDPFRNSIIDEEGQTLWG